MAQRPRRLGGIEPLTLSGPTDLKSAPRATWGQVGTMIQHTTWPSS